MLLQQLPYAAFERDALIRAAEVALSVTNRGHLFTWLRLHLHRFVPHELVLCHLPQQSGSENTHVFHSVPLAPDALDQLLGCGPRFIATLRHAWVGALRQPAFVELDGAPELRDTAEAHCLRRQGIARLLVHGVDASARLRSESLFAFAVLDGPDDSALAAGLTLWMPFLHAASMRALAAAPTAVEAGQAINSPLTAREAQVLQAVRHARRTDEVAELLGISPLTVKNHLRKIMAKLGARSRLHAVAEALSRQIIS